MRRILEAPTIYQSFQVMGGFFSARTRAIGEYLKLKAGDRVLDIGCGPGFIANHLPAGVIYNGFDIDRRYISYAQKHFGNRGKFHCEIFDQESARQFEGVDVVMMNGLLHHVDDQTALNLLKTAKAVLRPGGTGFTLDGCFRQNQSPFVRWLLESDRGRYVRTKEGYEELCGAAFERVDVKVREDLSWVPYTYAIGLLYKD
jgi:SAM-dependent methyltransferase